MFQSCTIAYLSLVYGLVSPSPFIRHYISLPISLFFFSKVVFLESLHPQVILERIYYSITALGGLVRTIELLLCSGDPHSTFVRLSDTAPIATQPLWKRVKWALALLASQRGGGWNWRVAGVPPDLSYPSTASFVAHAALRLFARTLALEALYLVFAYLGSSQTLWGPLVALHAAMIFITLPRSYELGSIIWVLCGFGGTEDCPPMWGSFVHACTLRGFWGKSWHQSFRRPATVIPDTVLALFGAKRTASSAAIGAFTVTGLFHALTLYALTRGAIRPCVNTFLFFAVQPLGFWFEDHILGLPASTRNPPRRRLHTYLGFLWVFTWLCLTARLYFAEMVASGFYDETDPWVEFPILTHFVSVKRR